MSGQKKIQDFISFKIFYCVKIYYNYFGDNSYE